MGKLDKEKETISWIKFWIGVSVASIMGLISWLVNNYNSSNKLMLYVDAISIIFLAIFIVILNKIGIKKINDLEDI